MRCDITKREGRLPVDVIVGALEFETLGLLQLIRYDSGWVREEL